MVATVDREVVDPVRSKDAASRGRFAGRLVLLEADAPLLRFILAASWLREGKRPEPAGLCLDCSWASFVDIVKVGTKKGSRGHNDQTNYTASHYDSHRPIRNKNNAHGYQLVSVRLGSPTENLFQRLTGVDIQCCVTGDNAGRTQSTEVDRWLSPLQHPGPCRFRLVLLYRLSLSPFRRVRPGVGPDQTAERAGPHPNVEPRGRGVCQILYMCGQHKY